MKKAASVLLVILCLFCMVCAASADTVSEGKVQVTLTADKAAYDEDDDITVKLSVTNETGLYITNVQMRHNLPEGYIWKDESTASKYVHSIADGGMQSLTATATPYDYIAPATGDGSHLGLWLLLLMAGGVSLAVCSRSEAAKRMMALVLCAACLTSVCPPAQAESIRDWPQKVAAFSRMRMRSAQTPVYTIDVTETVTIDDQETVLSARVQYSPMSQEDNLLDDRIDRGDIEVLRQKGTIEVITDDRGDIVVVDGALTDKKVKNTEEAAALLNSAAELFGDGFYADTSDIVQKENRYTDGSTEKAYTYSPTVNGIPVVGSQIVLVTQGDGTVSSLYSTYDDQVNCVDTNAEITAEEAVAAAKAALLKESETESIIQQMMDNDPALTLEEVQKMLLDSLDTETTEVIYAGADQLAIQYTYAVHLVKYIVDEQTLEPVGSLLNFTYYVAANGSSAGEIYSATTGMKNWAEAVTRAKDCSGVLQSLNVEVLDKWYQMLDNPRDITVRTWTGDTTGTVRPAFCSIVAFEGDDRWNSAADPHAVSGYSAVANAYDYYHSVIGSAFDEAWTGRLSILVHPTDSKYKDNSSASFAPNAIIIGDGEWDKCYDMMSHEFTHIVTDHNCGSPEDQVHGGLLMEYETGALDEAYCDIMGSLIEGRNGSKRWLMGEDKKTGAERSLAAPSAYGDREHYDDFVVTNLNDDRGGVHTNSTIFSHAAYKMMTDPDTARITDEMWANVFYRSMLRLPADATFRVARGAVINAAKELGFNGREQTAVKDAFDAVGIVEPDSLRIVLKWGVTPEDLDSHLVGPGVNGERFHVYFGQRSYDKTGEYDSMYGEYVADLDYDDVTSYGPEVTTIHVRTPGTYYFYVHDYTTYDDAQSTKLAQSGATVEIFRGSQQEATRSFEVSANSAGTIWNVFKLTIDQNGLPFIEEINTYGNEVMYH